MKDLDILDGLTDHEKLNFYETRITQLSDELYDLESGDPYRITYRPNPTQYDVKRIKHNIERFQKQREFILDRLKLSPPKAEVSSSRKNSNQSNQVFVAAWFDSSMDKSILAIEQGIIDAGLTPICIKDEHFSERIMDKALSEIQRSRFVIVDLTGNRPSVFFEAGFTFGSGIETIYVYNKSITKTTSQLEFYVKHYQCYEYDDVSLLRNKIREIILARMK